MAISRSLMNRQLRASGGIMDVTPRENFGLGSSLKKFVRKIIPNEVAEIATKAAPFVAPFNPALAGAMSGIGTFDQTGSISAGLKSGAMNYGLGQGARYLGGAGFQGNPFGQGGAFTGSGFRGGFSSPLGSETGLGKFFSKPNAPIQGINSGRGGDSASALSRSGATAQEIAAQGRAVNAEQTGLFTEGLTGGAEIIPTNLNDYAGTEIIPTNLNDYAGGAEALVDATDMTLVGDVKQAASQEFNLFKAASDKVKNFDYREAGNKALELGKKFGKAMFYDKEGNIDKAAVMGAIAFAGSYAEALALADDAGVELTEEAYDEARKVEKKEEYAGYLTNFFGGQKDGGRIGYEQGANELIMEKLTEDIMPDTSTEEYILIMGEDGVPIRVKKSDYEAMPGMFRDTTTSLYGDAARGRPVPEFADGGRVNRRLGSPEEGERGGVMEMLSVEVDAGGDEEEDMLMAYSDAIFDRREKSALFRSLGDPRIQQTTKSFKNLDKILKNPGMFPEDEFMMKEYLKLKGFKDGGRIGLKDGTGASNRVAQLILERDYLLSKDEDVSYIDLELESLGYKMKAEGGIMEAKVPTGQMRKNNAGVAERDYRQTGGFVPVGIKERADDVPAMLSKNEFVMTADAVRGLGNGSVEEGSKKLYNTMKQAEKVGKA